jgi:preprotein translocase subunit SecE
VATAGSGRASLTDYFRGVWEELKKVVWPTRDELARMTGIVIATVILFALLIGGADYVLSLGVRQVYTSSGQSTTSNGTPQTNPRITLPPSLTRPTAAPSHATPLP